MKKFRELFGGKEKVVIGMLHFPFIENPSKIDEVIYDLIKDIENLQRGGVNGILIENEYARKREKHPEFLENDEIVYYTTIVNRLLKEIKIRYGFAVLNNDYKTALSLSTLLRGAFIRLDVFADYVNIHGNIIKPQPFKILEYRKQLLDKYGCEYYVPIYTDIHSRWGQVLSGKTLKDTIEEAIENESDGIIINGHISESGSLCSELKCILDTLDATKKTAEEKIPVIVGSGVNEDNFEAYLDIADGAIIGTAFKENNRISLEKVKSLMSLL